MKILHITPSAKGYEEVTLLANRISKTNGFSADRLIKLNANVEYNKR